MKELELIISKINAKFASGRNDDDEVVKMVELSQKIKGWNFMPG
jgi:hypothetical protein